MAKHTAPDDSSFRVSLIRHAAAAVALVLAVGAAFWGVGQLRSDTPGDPVIAQPSEPSETEGTGTSGEDATDEPTDPEEPGDATPTESATDEPDDAATEETPTEEPADDATDDTDDATGAVAPGDVSVQVLDAVLDDAGVAAQGVADQMEADGYRVVVVNRAAVAYEVTTVFWTPGNEAAARQIAEHYGFSRVELRPDNLSDTVSVHVVVGRDY